MASPYDHGCSTGVSTSHSAESENLEVQDRSSQCEISRGIRRRFCKDKYIIATRLCVGDFNLLICSEVGGVTVVAERKAKGTTFVALHEPFEGGKSNIYEFRTIQQTDDGVAVSVFGKYDTGIDDRLMIRLGDNPEKPVTLADGRESFTFADRAYIRISRDKVEVQGDMRALRIPVKGKPKLLVNGKNQIASFMRGYLYYCVPGQ